jgi:CRISPR/Cas system-associated protein Cas5 (RAMP superfamily)
MIYQVGLKLYLNRDLKILYILEFNRKFPETHRMQDMERILWEKITMLVKKYSILQTESLLHVLYCFLFERKK